MKIKWGIISTAKIGRTRVIPAMQQGDYCEITAIASRNLAQAEEAAKELGIPKAYGSYDELLADPEIDAIYNPLPNHLHLEWTTKAMEAGKHVLCEKPLALTIAEVEKMIEVRDKCGVKAGEAFMVKSHPQWKKAREMAQSGELGDLRFIHAVFSYYNDDPQNIRNIKEYGGGGVWDIGCYPVTTTRYVFGEEPIRLVATLDNDPKMGTDRLASVIMEFSGGKQAIFTVSTQASGHQFFSVSGTKARLEFQTSFTPDKRLIKLFLDKGDIFRETWETIAFDAGDQYKLQGDAFSKAILDDTEVPVTFEDALKNTKVLLAIFKSAETGGWVEV
ncbi:Gfo/Idh/MocA family oxidoreductase [Flammeovirgaceae bacterium SG7u.111]|nr:Gfo/Idh/MocA family oxidoreductase [Flammeovirgaceae bacterium SG7u.132]WPO34778.1 Gfo/Idh/MocA family oxidoreductase [Flammeovirgaceae bacterium SG7u.111]